MMKELTEYTAFELADLVKKKTDFCTGSGTGALAAQPKKWMADRETLDAVPTPDDAKKNSCFYHSY